MPPPRAPREPRTPKPDEHDPIDEALLALDGVRSEVESMRGEVAELADAFREATAAADRDRRHAAGAASDLAAIRRWIDHGGARRAVRGGTLAALGVLLVLSVVLAALAALGAVYALDPAIRAMIDAQ